MAMLLLFALAACNDTASPSTAPTEEATLESTPQPTDDAQPTPDAATPDADPTDDASLPQGTMFDLPAPFENHPSDAQHFYAPGDDVFAVMYHAKQDPNTAISGQFTDYENVTRYMVYVFDENENLQSFYTKYVFASPEEAERFVKDNSNYLAVDNIAYFQGEQALSVTDKTGIIQAGYGTASKAGGSTYFSMPEGYEEYQLP